MEHAKQASELEAGEHINLFGDVALVTDVYTYAGVYGQTTELTYAYMDYLEVDSVMRIRATSLIPLAGGK